MTTPKFPWTEELVQGGGGSVDGDLLELSSATKQGAMSSAQFAKLRDLDVQDITALGITADNRIQITFTNGAGNSETHQTAPLPTRGPGGASTFAALTDTPNSLSGEGGKRLVVNAGGTAIEFTDSYSLPALLRDFGHDLGGEGYQLVTAAVSNTYRSQAQGAFTLAQAQAAAFESQPTYGGARLTNIYVALRLTEGQELENLQLWIGDETVTRLSLRVDLGTTQGLVHLGAAGGYDYYSLLVSDVGGAEYLSVRQHDPVGINLSRVGFTNVGAAASWDNLITYDSDDGLIKTVAQSLLDDRYRQVPTPGLREVTRLPRTGQSTGDTVLLNHRDHYPNYDTVGAQQGVAQRQFIFQPNLALPGVTGTTIATVVAFSSSYTGSNNNFFNGRAFVQLGGNAVASLDLVLDINGTLHPVTATAVDSGLSHYHEIPTLAYGDLVAGTEYQVRFQRRDNSVAVPANREYPRGTYEWDGTSWELKAGTVAPWAEAGNDDPIPVTKLTHIGRHVLLDGPAVGVSPSNLNNAARSAGGLNLFTPLFDLDNEDTATGTFLVEGTFTLTQGSAGVSFTDSATSVEVAGIAVASRLLRNDNLYSSTAARGIEVGGTTLDNGGAAQGTIKVYLARNALNQVGYYVDYVNTGGSAGGNANVSLDLTVVFTANDRGQPETNLIPATVAFTSWTQPGIGQSNLVDSGIRISKTPSSTAARVFVEFVNIVIALSGLSNRTPGYTFVVRRGTSSSSPEVARYRPYFDGTNNNQISAWVGGADAPATTSEVTYTLWWSIDRTASGGSVQAGTITAKAQETT